MHFSLIGPNSFYRLTMAEIHRLQVGYNQLHAEEIANAKKGNKKHTGRRKSDSKKLDRLRQRKAR